ncbi:hypothetical protein [Amycolatopsis thermoflava]|uniref:hypothetical protein n=1 Tax=Amycolatopsis thermoflava TaxID=84480 RepID=UPI0038125089
MRRYLPVAAIALLLTGCSTTTPQRSGSLPEQPTLTAPTSNQTETSSQTGASGYVPLELGDTAELSAEVDGSKPATWTIEKIEIDPPCSGRNGSSDTGHVLVLHVRADSGPDKYAAEQIPDAFRYTSFAEPGKNGTAIQASPSLCKSSEPHSQPLPVPYQLNQQLTGTVALIVPEANGTLIQNNPLLKGEGWRWSYPAK